MTTPPHLETVEDLFEVAIHSIHPERKGYGQLWLDYLVLLACKATSVKSIKVYQFNSLTADFEKMNERVFQFRPFIKFFFPILTLCNN